MLRCREVSLSAIRRLPSSQRPDCDAEIPLIPRSPGTCIKALLVSALKMFGWDTDRRLESNSPGLRYSGVGFLLPGLQLRCCVGHGVA